MASVIENMTRAKDDLLAIKNAVIGTGVEIPDGTPSSLFADKISEVYEKGKSESSGSGGDTTAAYDEGYEQGKADEAKRLLEARATGTEPSGDIVIEAETIAEGAFAYCKTITNVVLPNAISLGNTAFYQTAITSITMPKVETIYGSAFYMSRNMTDIVLPATLKSIGATAFGYTVLKTVTFEGTPESISTNAFTGSNQLIDIYVPWSEGAVAGAPWSATKATIHYNSGV